MVKILFITLLLPSLVFGKMTIPNNLGDLCSPSDKDFIEYRYKENVPVCERNVSTTTKDKICKRDGVLDRTNYLVNHVVSLFAGGSNSEKNLYCQPKNRNTADKEYILYQKLKSNEMTIEEVRLKLKEINDKLIKELNS